jgi:hypothetical protein
MPGTRPIRMRKVDWLAMPGPLGHQPAWLSFRQTLYRKLASDGVRTESITGHDVVVIGREAMRVHASSW